MARPDLSVRKNFFVQLSQLVDALLIWIAFRAGGAFRTADELLDAEYYLYLAVPFTPLILEPLGLYRNTATKGYTTAIRQILIALTIIALTIHFFRLWGGASATPFPAMELAMAFFLLLTRGRVSGARATRTLPNNQQSIPKSSLTS